MTRYAVTVLADDTNGPTWTTTREWSGTVESPDWQRAGQHIRLLRAGFDLHLNGACIRTIVDGREWFFDGPRVSP